MEPFVCSHDELKWGRKKEVISGREIIVCGRCREEVAATFTHAKCEHTRLNEDGICRICGEDCRGIHP